MSWQDRPYAHHDADPPTRRQPVYQGPGMEPLSTTTSIIIANAVVFYLMFISSDRALAQRITEFGVMQAQAVLHGQVWRLFTATYMHANLNHILLNMLGLYFLGPALERRWGRRQFFLAYTIGGIAGNILLTVAGLLGFLDPLTLGVGASGSVLTLLGAAAVLFPEAEIYVYFLLPVRIRTFVVAYSAWFVYNIVSRGANYGGDLCHVAGLIVGLAWGFSGGVSISGRHRTAADPRSMIARARALLRPRGPTARSHPQAAPPPRGQFPTLQRESSLPGEPSMPSHSPEALKGVLAKVAQSGIESLSPEERAILIDAARHRDVRQPD